MDKTKQVFAVRGKTYRIAQPSKMIDYISSNNFQSFKKGVESYFDQHEHEFTLINNDGSPK